MEGLQLIATGGALPSRTVTNEDLSRTVDTSDEWIVSRTGIRMRHWCAPEESAPLGSFEWSAVAYLGKRCHHLFPLLL